MSQPEAFSKIFKVERKEGGQYPRIWSAEHNGGKQLSSLNREFPEGPFARNQCTLFQMNQLTKFLFLETVYEVSHQLSIRWYPLRISSCLLIQRSHLETLVFNPATHHQPQSHELP